MTVTGARCSAASRAPIFQSAVRILRLHRHPSHFPPLLGNFQKPLAKVWMRPFGSRFPLLCHEVILFGQ